MPRKIKNEDSEDKLILPSLESNDAIRGQLLDDLSDESIWVISPDLMTQYNLGSYSLESEGLSFIPVLDQFLQENVKGGKEIFMFKFKEKANFIEWLLSLRKGPITVYQTHRFDRSFPGAKGGGGLSIFRDKKKNEKKFRINIQAANEHDVAILSSFFLRNINNSMDESKRRLLTFAKEGIIYKDKGEKKPKLYWGEIKSTGENKNILSITRDCSLIQKNKEKIYALDEFTAEPITTTRGENWKSLVHGIQLMKKGKVKEKFWFKSIELRNQFLKVIEG